MILLIGALALLAAAYGLSSPAARGGGRAWAALLVAALPLIALIGARGELERYRFSLLATRYRVQDERGIRPDTLVVSGHAERADLLVPGAGERPLAVLAPEGDSALERIVARPRRDAAAVLLVEEERTLGGDAYHVLGAVALAEGDTVEVAGHRLAVVRQADRLGRLPIPWARVHALERVGGAQPWLDDAPAAQAGARVIIPPAGGWRRYLVPRRPGVLERSYPLADLLDALAPEDAGTRPGLSSFVFHDDDGRLALALLDSEVRVAERAPPPLPVWTRGDGGRRVLVAGLPHRDFPEAELTLPERYGVRPLRSVRFNVTDGWLEARPSRPEIHALDRDALAELDIGGGDDDAYRIRLSPAGGTLLRQAVVFRTPSRGFAAAGQAVFILPKDPSSERLDVITPSGIARWRTHHPLSLGDGARSVLLRVDGQAASAGTLLAYALLLALAVSVFWIWALPGRLYALAVLLLGLAGVRLLLGLSAHAQLPFDQEAQQLALWVAPFLPWLVVVGRDLGAALRGAWTDAAPGDAEAAGLREPAAEAGAAASGPLTSPAGAPVSGRTGEAPRWGWHLAFAVALASLAWVLFPDALGKRLVLALLPAALLGVLALVRARPPALSWKLARVRAHARRPEPAATLRSALLGPGLTLGLLLLGLRLALSLLGAREQVVLLGTRLGVSVLYTPLSLVVLAWILWRGGRRLAAARGREADREGAWLLANVGVFVLLAFAGVSVAISDYGILFTTLPGALVLLVALGWRWTPRTSRPGVAMAVLAAPLVLFVAVQVSPSILHPGGAADPQEVDGRMAEWSRNELLLLEREDPQALRLIGQRRSEALAVMRETMRSYTRGNWTGRGFLDGRVSEEVRPTATREHVPSALLAAQWGLAGTAGLLLLLAGLLLPLRRIGAAGGGALPPPHVPARATLAGAAAFLVAVALLPRPFGFVAAALLVLAVLAVLVPTLGGRHGAAAFASSPRGAVSSPRGGEPAPVPEDAPTFARLLAGLFLATLAFAGIYMVLANYGWVLFTGKNVYLLGLDSVSDLLESTLLVATAAAALVFAGDASSAQPRPLPALRRRRRSS